MGNRSNKGSNTSRWESILNLAKGSAIQGHQNYWDWLLELFKPPQPIPAGAAPSTPGPGPMNGKRDIEIPQLTDQDIAEAQRQIRRIARQLISKLSRQRKHTNKRKCIDFRATMRRSVSTGGVFVDVKWKMKVIKKPKIVAVIDTSGSMERFVKMLIQLVQAIGLEISDLELFIFADNLQHATDCLTRDWQGTVDNLKKKHQWGRGTDIERSLRTLIKNHSGVLTSRTIVLLLSDLGTSQIPLAAQRVTEVRRKVKKFYVFNSGHSLDDVKKDPENTDYLVSHYEYTIKPFVDTSDGVFTASTIEGMANAMKHACLK